MRRGRIFFGGALLLAAFSVGAAPALAATPIDICNDLKDGKVDGTYTADEWNAFFNDPTIQGYGCGPAPVPPTVVTPVVPLTPVQPAPVVATPAPVVAEVAGVQVTKVEATKTATPTASVLGAKSPTKQAAAPLATTTTKSGPLPFTGVELGLFALVGLALIGSGLLLRRTSRQRS